MIADSSDVLEINIDYEPQEKDNQIVMEGLISSNERIMGESRDKEFSIFLRDRAQKIFGGLQAHFDKESIYIEALWVDEKMRGKGYGHKIIHAAEQEALKNGCIFSTVATLDFQAEPFYVKNGYMRIGEIKKYWYEHSFIYLRKNLK